MQKLLTLNLAIFLPFFILEPANAQTISNEDWGVTFTLPSGWTFQYDEQADGYLFQKSMMHNTLMTLHPIDDRALLKQALQKMVKSDFGETVSFSEFKDFNKNDLSSQFSGYINGNSVSGEVIGLISPHGGGVLIMEFLVNMNQPPSFATNLAKTINFNRPVADANVSANLSKWNKYLKDSRLSYYESYSSYDGIGGYTGFRDKTILDLCAQGYFRFSYSSEMAVDAGTGGLAKGSEANKGDGVWEVRRMGKRFVLKLKFYDGKVDFYTLQFIDDDYVNLNETKFIRTTKAHELGYRPQCDF